MRRHFSVIAVFLLIAGMFAFVEARPQFPDPDSFYHAKMALMIRDQGFIHAFPWLQYTVLATGYVDYHLGYHLLLIPFVTLFDPLVGMKVAAGVFGWVAFYALYRVLKWFQTPRPEVLTLLAACSTTFFHRMSLPRAPSLSVAILLVVAGAMIKKKPWLVFVVAFAYVWFYYGWPLLFTVLLAVLVADFMSGKLIHERRVPFTKTVLALFAGIIAGLVLNPYFPQNVVDTARDVFKIAVVNYQSVIAVGTEWYPATIGDIVSGAVFILCALALAVAFFIPAAASMKRSPTRAEITTVFSWFFLTGGFFLLTLKSGRFIEYAVPCMTLTTGVLFIQSRVFVEEVVVPELRRWFKEVPGKSLLLGVLGFALACFLFVELTSVLPNKEYFTADAYQPSVDWIIAHVPKNDLVFHNGWDFSLVLFYLDDTHRYLVGLDPTYMYDAYPAEYAVWLGLIDGTDKDVGKIMTQFHAEVVVVDTRIKTDFEKNIQDSGMFDTVIADGSIHLYTAK